MRLRCPVCSAEAAILLLATGREGQALAVLRKLPGDIEAAIGAAREEGRQDGIRTLTAAMLREAAAEEEAPARKPARKRKAPRRAVAPA